MNLFPNPFSNVARHRHISNFVRLYPTTVSSACKNLLFLARTSTFGSIMCAQKNEDFENTISAGKYIIINRKKFSKLHLLTDNSTVQLGKDKVNLNGILGCRFWSTFKLVPKNSKREFTLTACRIEEIIVNEELLKSKTKSGWDNRNIWDDGSSQSLSTEQIIELRDSGISSQAIVGCLVENSKTFHNKTEYSQEKYLKKKGTKYFEYLTIKRPTIRLLSEFFYLQDPMKILGLRNDSLSQVITAVNLQPDGSYLLYENGSQGLVAATVLNYLSESGKLIYITPGKHPQKHAILAMNFNKELDRLKCISLAKLFDDDGNVQAKGGCADNKHVEFTTDEPILKESGNVSLHRICEVNDEQSIGISKETEICASKPTNDDTMKNLSASDFGHKKRKPDGSVEFNAVPLKKAKWELEAEEVLDLLRSKTMDGLIIVCKEYPSSLLKKLLNFIEYSRPFVVFNLFREPLVEMYTELKSRHDIINLRLTETWMRSYQVLVDRTHPEVLMSGNSGHLLSGMIVNNL